MAAGTPATTVLTRGRVPFTLHSYEVDPGAESYGQAAATALGVPPQQLFKTLIARVDGRAVCAVVAVSGSLDLKALARARGGKKAVMAEPDDAERLTGYVIGGISPLGHRSRLDVVVDASITEFPSIFVSAGRRGLQLELAPTELIRLARASVADIAG